MEGGNVGYIFKGDLSKKTSLRYGLIWLVQPEYAITFSFLDHENIIFNFLHCSICKIWTSSIWPQTLEPSFLSAWNYISQWWLFVKIKFYKLLSPLQPMEISDSKVSTPFDHCFFSYLSKTTVNNNKKTHYLTITIDVVNINRFHNYQNNQSVIPEKLSQNSYCFIIVHVVCSICTSTVHREDLLQFCITIEWHTCIKIKFCLSINKQTLSNVLTGKFVKDIKVLCRNATKSVT